MPRQRQPSLQTISVLRALLTEPEVWRYGYQLCLQLGLKSGSLYAILMRLADRGLLETGWESDPPRGRPPRHLYRLTPDGREVARQLEAKPSRRTVGAVDPGIRRRAAW